MAVHLFKANREARVLRSKGRGPRVFGLLPLPHPEFIISGITKDETGAATPGFTVYLFKMVDGIPTLMDMTVSDGSGVYSFTVNGSDQYWATSYKSGAPDKAGATLQTLVGVSA
jgi:hypothetical protein